MTIPASANPLLLSGSAAAGGYTIERSIRLNSADSAYLSRTPASAGNRKTWTWAGWVKRSALGVRQNIFGTSDASANNSLWIEFFNADALRVVDYTTSVQFQVITTQVFRDVSAWAHLVVSVDTTQGTASNRVKMYWNGLEITQFSTATYPGASVDTQLNTATAHGIGRAGSYDAQYFNGYLADIHLVDGQALDPTSFGEFDTNGVWQPTAYAGSYGTNGFHLPFSDNSTAAALGTDTSGNNHTWTVNNISVAAGAGNDSLVDVPTASGEDTGAGAEVRGNYCTLNPLDCPTTITLLNGNLDAGVASGTNSKNVRSTLFPASEKWYWEMTVNGLSSGVWIGIATSAVALNSGAALDQTGGYSYGSNGNFYSGSTSDSAPATYTTGDVIGCAWDVSAGTLQFYKNGASQGTLSSIAPGAYSPAFTVTSGSDSLSINFGQRPFAYTAPSGFKALCTTNLPEPDPNITPPSKVMDVALYTGNGTTQTISGLNLSPDLVWIKNRTDNVSSHALFDIVRGTDKRLRSNGTDSELSPAIYGSLTAFNSDGFTVAPGSDPTDPAIETCKSSKAYVAWTWDAGSSTVTNNDGSIASQVRTNGYLSIVSYTAAYTGSARTVGHGLGVKPSLIILKNRNDGSANWRVYHSASGASLPLVLNSTAAASANIGIWNNTEPTSSVFTIGVNTDVGGNIGSGEGLIAYCFAPVAGYSALGSYTGNGSADGPFVYTGMRPRWILVKASSSVTYGSWRLHDTSRDPYNVCGNQLLPNLPDKEYGPGAVGPVMDILSNGFKLRSGFDGWNGSSATYIYAAFAEHPFQTARAR